MKEDRYETAIVRHRLTVVSCEQFVEGHRHDVDYERLSLLATDVQVLDGGHHGAVVTQVSDVREEFEE